MTIIGNIDKKVSFDIVFSIIIVSPLKIRKKSNIIKIIFDLRFIAVNIISDLVINYTLK